MRKLRLDYLGYILFMTILGGLPGMFFQGYLTKMTGRTSYNVFILASALVVAVLGTLGIGIPIFVHQSQEVNLFAIQDYCTY